MGLTKVQKKHKNITGLKVWPTVNKKRKIERGCEEEKEGFPVLIFPPLRFRIVRMFPASVGFCSQVSAIWGKHDWSIFEPKREFYIEFEVLLMTGFLVVKEAFIPLNAISMMWCSLPFA